MTDFELLSRRDEDGALNAIGSIECTDANIKLAGSVDDDPDSLTFG